MAGAPSTVICGISEPRVPSQAVRPVGSGMMPPSARSPDAATASEPAPVDSSSVTVLTIRSPASGMESARSTSVASSILATPPFMSHAPRP